MAEQIPDSSRPSEPTGFQAHDWYPYDAYLNVHQSHIERLLRNGTILDERLSFIESYVGRSLTSVNLRGRILCTGEVLIIVDKWLGVRRNRRRQVEVKGTSYVYHARLRKERRDLVRYCSAHGLDDLHRHEFDASSGVETGRPNIRLSELPTLGAFVEEAVILGRQARGVV